ncbi:hypothetical protein GUITHDRAFT_136461 [Guillardia theta CCMP2712]|uniref:SWIM-type domain-containing protein n=2 Tax=Guillardia theta TaxID=55529 RepID=L1JJV8_GUITC|nr:hypothetical protein GUITHDRAFT_136461 [Guillardia theta CCMP2712]EKX48793.1 hypothetical protein GUITHDRAFT_136461 [Guillardia theta CCMP2712]|eukprot:XP_005835773.1 hypothetical protein GUITHDRAFT_136461 [Guillardia theta CCMP2712]
MAGIGAVEGAMSDAMFEDMERQGELSDSILFRMTSIFKRSTLEASLALVDKGYVQKIVSDSGRSLFLVESSQDDPYVCFKHFCPCHYFSYNVINKMEALTCKHILAARIANALKRADIVNVTNEEFSKWLMKQEPMKQYVSPNKSR